MKRPRENQPLYSGRAALRSDWSEMQRESEHFQPIRRLGFPWLWPWQKKQPFRCLPAV